VLACFVFDRFLNLEKRKKLFSQYGKARLDDRFPSSKSGGFGRPIPPYQGSWRLVARRIHSVFSKSLELVFPEKAPTFLAILPSSVMFLIIMEVANAVVFMLELAMTAPSIGEVRRVAANPLVAAGSFHQWCTVITAKATDLTGNRFRFHPIICHRYISFLHRFVFTRSACLPIISFARRMIIASESPR
jgi:hypothetical protein